MMMLCYVNIKWKVKKKKKMKHYIVADFSFIVDRQLSQFAKSEVSINTLFTGVHS